MAVLRSNIDFAKAIFADRLGNDYVYGGVWNPNDTNQGCDCSALVAHVLNAVIYGPLMQWNRIDPTHNNAWITTESWRPIEIGQVGPFGTITVGSPADMPADAIVRINLHHGPGGGENSHMNCICDSTYMESSGSYGCCTSPGGAISENSSYWNDHAYLPGPILGAAPDGDYSSPASLDALVHQFL